MDKEAEKFIKAEETAAELVSTLTQLSDEAISYKTAKKELESVRQDLISMIDSTKQLAICSHEIITTLKEIGALEIIERLVKLRFLVILTLGSSVVALVLSLIGIFT